MAANIDPSQYLFHDDPLYTAIGLGIIAALIYLEIFVHEAGHWLAAKLCRYRIFGLSVGEGKLLWTREKEHRFVELRLFPVEGYVLAIKEQGWETRLHSVVLSAGGPVFTLLYAGLAALGYHAVDFSFLGDPWALFATQILAVVVVLSLISFVYNLWPHYGQLGEDRVANDGKAILRSLFSPSYPRPNFYQAALRELLPAQEEEMETDDAEARYLRETPEAKEAFIVSRYYFYRAEFALSDAALDAVLQGQRLGKIERATLLNAYADSALASCERDAIRTALGKNREALVLIPHSELLRARRGALLTEQQSYREAQETLSAIIEEAESSALQAYCHCYLALGRARSGDSERACEELKLARRADPTCPVIPVIHDEIHGVSPGYRKNVGA